MEKSNLRILIRNLAIEMVIYGVLLVNFFAVLRVLGGFLTNLFETQLTLYAFLGLALIVAQAVLLENVTSALIRWLRLDKIG